MEIKYIKKALKLTKGDTLAHEAWKAEYKKALKKEQV